MNTRCCVSTGPARCTDEEQGLGLIQGHLTLTSRGANGYINVWRGLVMVHAPPQPLLRPLTIRVTVTRCLDNGPPCRRACPTARDVTEDRRTGIGPVDEGVTPMVVPRNPQVSQSKGCKVVEDSERMSRSLALVPLASISEAERWLLRPSVSMSHDTYVPYGGFHDGNFSVVLRRLP
ncbi:hypothetical protein LIA77_00799 [Sarocladium implicatum]|nr:hypothetical protein LIA77_00799 [Sarocladium implicatum]